jgi:hypothetical protein
MLSRCGEEDSRRGMVLGSLVSDARWKNLVELLDEKFWVVPFSASPNE